MYNLELRFLVENANKVHTYLSQIEKDMEIISVLNGEYYICYKIKNPISKKLYDELKSSSIIYFVSYYKI